jgi:hypothetical protein
MEAETTEEVFYEEATTQKIYTLKSIRAATFFGGPLVAGYLISENYRVFNEDKKSKMAFVYAAVATIILFGIVFIIPPTAKVPTYIIPLIYSWLTYLIVQQLMGDQMKVHVSAGGSVFTIWRALLVGLIGAVVTFGGLFILLLITGLL